MTTPKVAAQIKSQPRPLAPGPVTATTEAPPQSLLAKQHNLVPMVVGTADTQQQDIMPLEGAEKELLMERVRNTGAQTPSSLAAQIERELQQKSST
ncbi:hypothetical protein MKX08_002973 [Trichoderma sp. CBMAI-0020]|nr:hypothetical protein MKX08_002973 [Trichoderma sp. CBMAI-0020]